MKADHAGLRVMADVPVFLASINVMGPKKFIFSDFNSVMTQN